MKKIKNLKVSIVMGSQSDYRIMKLAEKTLKKIGVSFETKIISAHRTPKRMFNYALKAQYNNIGVIIAGAVGTLAIGEDGAINAALLAASIIANQNNSIKNKLNKWRSNQTKSIKKNPK